ncbi:integrative and conjugative element protein (TIGR02256 family) [Arcicella rosea]|uniref:ThiF family adenylyltransferase n=1 Tax=Arcicella rosea TaxID=502909 RepID=UPI00345CB5E1
MLQWFKNHPDFLRQESTALSNDSNYKELTQHRDNLFISHGNIIVRINGIHRFPILIIYTNATPYHLPMVFPLENNLSEQQVKELATLNLIDAIKKSRPLIKFYYNLRHQNSSGELCILERDELDSTGRFYGIATILQRVRDWCAGHITGQYPLDSEEVNFEVHFNFINNDTKLFYGENFLDASLLEGDFYATLFKVVPKAINFNEDKYIYSGCFIDGIGENQLIQPFPIDISHLYLHEKIKTSFDIYTESTIVTKLIEDRRLLKAHWFHISQEPLPFEKLSDLIFIIGNGDYEVGLKRVTTRCVDSFKSLADFFYIAIRFPNRKGLFEFQLFKIRKKESLVLFQGGAENDVIKKMQFILDCYEKVEAVESDKLTPETFHQRNSKRADYMILKDAFVNILGVGAIGSEIADCTAKAGVGNIALFDNQTIQAHNAVRHLAGIEYIGAPKVHAVFHILQNHNPFVIINPLIGNLYNLNAVVDLQDDSLSICSVADDNVEGFINQQLVMAGKTAFYVRALRGGKTARVFRVIPGKDACFQCLHLYRKDRDNFIDIPEDPDYPTLKNECNNPIRPASAADLKFISAMVTRLVIEHIQNGESENNHWIWTTDEITGTPLTTPNHLYSQHIPPHKNCVYCHHETKVSVTIDPECIAFMQSLIKNNPSIETGGVMAGKIDDKGNVYVTHVSEPGPKAIMTSTKFEKDVEFCQTFLDERYKQSSQNIVYVGEWHSHPSVNNQPSGTDIKSLSEIAVEKNYLTSCPAMIIFSNTGKPSCTLHPAGKLYYFTELNINNN